MNVNKTMGIRPCTWVYILLITFTCVTFFIGQMGLSGIKTSLFVLLLALIKGELVGAYFMGLGRLRGMWRWPVIIWLFIPGIMIGTAFYLAG